MSIAKRYYPILLGEKGELDPVELDFTVRNSWLSIYSLQEDVTLMQESVAGAIRRGEIAKDDAAASITKVDNATRTSVVTAPTTITGAKLVNPISGRLPFINGALELDGGANAPEYNPSTKTLTIRGALNITGASALTGNVIMGGTLNTAGAVVFQSTLNVTGAAILSSTLGVTGTTTLDGIQIIDVTNAEALLVRADSDGGDVFAVNTTTPGVIITGTLSVSGTSLLSGTTTTFGRIKTVTRKTTTYVILVTDSVIFGNTDGGAWTATLPAGVSGQTYRIINSGSSGNILTVTPNGSEHLLGVNSSFNLFDAEALDLTYDATDGWY